MEKPPGLPEIPRAVASARRAGNHPSSPAATSHAVRALLAHREQLDDRVGSRCNILGSMIGVKVRDGKTLPGVGITYFVREKIPLNELTPRSRIPKVLQLDDKRIVTDVMVWRETEQHSLKDTRILMDQATQGTLTAFAETSSGLFGLTCGHCLLGADQNPTTRTEICMDATPSPLVWTPIGMSALVLFLNGGPLLLGGKGYVDCGLFSLSEVTLRTRAEASKLVQMAEWTSLPGQILYGVSTVDAVSGDNHQRQAKVLGVQGYALDEFCDVVLDAAAPGMRRGDSGMLWFTSQMRAAAIHCRGEYVDQSNGSVRITAMSAQRAAAALGFKYRIG
ncbi:hypothetical protein [Zoogloea sp.]|uniref:hypothetical protein n=1 Tax=Zoogloea sp. TaxID=49181 RepID=UPI002FE1443F